MYESDIGWRLRNVRESRGLSRKDVENMTGGEFKESILAMYENARRRIPTPRLKRLADFYDISVAWLVGEAVAQSSNKEIDIEALLMADPNFSENERRLMLDMLEMIKAKRRAEGRE
ncbi:MAG: helix-turn-helix transcriptional regulator [Actinobacteria bacterium]|nr:helix-turn-helix transcriptional regulator [Actinomycetota bacterium]